MLAFERDYLLVNGVKFFWSHCFEEPLLQHIQDWPQFEESITISRLGIVIDKMEVSF